jgi:hypothetical protein
MTPRRRPMPAESSDDSAGRVHVVADRNPAHETEGVDCWCCPDIRQRCSGCEGHGCGACVDGWRDVSPAAALAHTAPTLVLHHTHPALPLPHGADAGPSDRTISLVVCVMVAAVVAMLLYPDALRRLMP